MIPKKIHYCWFGSGEKPKLALRCIASWKKYCPDYEIIEWNEDNFDVNQNAYTAWCYENKKWAFLSDYARLVIIRDNGGIYFDTDVELLRNPDELMTAEAFFGFENSENINTGEGFGAVPGHQAVNAMLEIYQELVPDEDGNYPVTACPALNTAALLPFGIQLNGKRQSFNGVEILPVDYLNPYESTTGRLRKTPNTLSVHWYSKSWLSKKQQFISTCTKPFHRLFGTDCFKMLKK